jgi:hypothetical protein
VDAQYKSLVESTDYRGVAVGVITPDEGAAFFCYGVGNASGAAITRDTAFSINSMTKVRGSHGLHGPPPHHPDWHYCRSPL